MANYKTGPGNYKSSYFRLKVKQVDQIVNNSSTLENDDELFLSVKANRVYHFRVQWFITTSAASDFKWAMSVPSGATGRRTDDAYFTSALKNTADISATRAYAGASTSELWVITDGRVVTGSTSGNIQFTWAQNTAQVFDTKVLQGSILEVSEI